MTRQENSVQLILERRGYKRIRPTDADEWKSLDEIGDRYGTTDQTQIKKLSALEGLATLTDLRSGELVAEVQKGHPESTSTGKSSSENTAGVERGGDDIDQSEVDRLISRAALPNTRTAAYLLAMACKEKLRNPDHDLLVTAANLAVLKAWDEGLSLTDLDKLTFDVEQREGESRLAIEGQERSLSVQLKPRTFSLEQPWDGMYSAVTVAGRVDD